MTVRLGVNIDHVATLRNARGGLHPDPVAAALLAIEAGADGITAHLREDRRHIRDDDMRRLKAAIGRPLNFEMAATEEMVAIALAIKPNACCLVPEKRAERTTEGGLDVVAGAAGLTTAIGRLRSGGIRVSVFIEPSFEMIEAAKALRADIVEFHTGAWCEAVAAGHIERAADLQFQLADVAQYAHGMGLEVHAGHGLTFATAEILASLPEFVELNIGHFLVGEAVFTGLETAIKTMQAHIALGVARRERT